MALGMHATNVGAIRSPRLMGPFLVVLAAAALRVPAVYAAPCEWSDEYYTLAAAASAGGGAALKRALHVTVSRGTLVVPYTSRDVDDVWCVCGPPACRVVIDKGAWLAVGSQGRAARVGHRADLWCERIGVRCAGTRTVALCHVLRAVCSVLCVLCVRVCGPTTVGSGRR